MNELPQYTLGDAVSWLTTRKIPLSQFACNETLAIINNDSDFQALILYFAGLNAENSLTFLYSFNGLGDNFYQIANSIYVPQTLFIAIQYATINNQYLLDVSTIQALFDCIQMTPEFSPFIEALNGITPENSNTYNRVYDKLIGLPMFLINSQKFLLA